VHDADDAVQEALVRAWKGIDGFEGRSSLRSWLYTIATNVCVRLAEGRARRVRLIDVHPPAPDIDVESYDREHAWLEPYPAPQADEALAHVETIELAFVAALQYLPATQRAAVVLCDALDFAAAEAASVLDTSVASLNSALQRGRTALAERAPAVSQQAALRELGADGERALVAAFVDAWARRDVDAIVALLAKDARFTMPPLRAWLEGRDAIARFFAERVFATEWRLAPLRASAQLAFLCYQGPAFGVGALNVVTLRGREIAEMTGFLDPAVHGRFLPAER
jgi:RNA polymerase sigma-70 factor (ECF subfamily)